MSAPPVSSGSTSVQRGPPPERDRKGKRPLQFRGMKKNWKSGKKQRVPEIPACQKCGKHHRGECLTGQAVCFRCRQPGHIAHFCTAALVRVEQQQPIRGATARVYPITQGPAEANPSAVTGTGDRGSCEAGSAI
ncbi:uncharacterized protein LOC123227728 [Mangifera indica]|uniref:uncharacterized protein LOC123227728 n=1 Tax=Mangifera indica TaxID=29780 RepID=UPI001CFBA5DE|nr:uncharacterized protein LOC123227728 [Mangifera indica]